MSASRITPLATAIVSFATAAAAEMPAKDQPEPAMEMQPVMDRPILAHLIFNQLEGRFNGSNPEFRWDGQGWVGTDYDKLWIKSEGTLQSNGTLDDGQQQFLYARAITTYFDLQGGRAATSIRALPAIGPLSAFRAWHPTSSISRSPALSAARAILPASSRLPTTYC